MSCSLSLFNMVVLLRNSDINTAIARSVKLILSYMLHVFNILSSWLFFSRRCEWVAFLYVFGYLFFFRTCTFFGFEKPPEHSNAIQLLVTLRVSYELTIFDFGRHPCYGQLTAVKTRYLLTRRSGISSLT